MVLEIERNVIKLQEHKDSQESHLGSVVNGHSLVHIRSMGVVKELAWVRVPVRNKVNSTTHLTLSFFLNKFLSV